jgi:WD40 repeat protein
VFFVTGSLPHTFFCTSLLAVLLSSATCCLAAAQDAASYPAEPVLRLETGMHTAQVKRIDVDRQERLLVSASDDKTVRIWDLATGTLQRTLRVPLATGHVGKLYSVAIAPDGALVAAGGWTGHGQGTTIIYIFDRQTGEIRHTITGLADTISHLAFSPDGRYLAALLGGANGLLVYETGSFTQVYADREYAYSSYWGEFDRSGRLVTTSLDGYIRLYSPDWQLLHKKQAPGGKEPCGVAFAPDGKSLALGYNDSTRVDVLAADSLEPLFSADTSGTNGNFATVAWSRDGRLLYAAGEYAVSNRIPIRCWDEGGQGRPVESLVATNTVMGLKPLANGRLVVGAQDPLMALLDSRGRPIWQQQGEIADFRGQRGENSIRLSADGRTIRFGFKMRGENPATFSLAKWQLDLEAAVDRGLHLPVGDGVAGLDITDWIDSLTPKLNTIPLKLQDYEFSRSLAIAPDKRHFLLGSEWYLRLFDQQGKKVWRVAAPGIAWAVNISRDGRLAVAGFGDGTLRWFDMQDGKELLALFPHPDGRWVAWTTQGFYQASAGGEDLIGWHLNHGTKQAPDFYGASRFRAQFYRPDVVAKVLETLDVGQALQLADQARGEKTVTRELRDILPPQIVILSPPAGTTSQSSKLTLAYKASSTTGPVTAVEARIDGRPATVLAAVTHAAEDNRARVVAEMTVEVPARDAVVSLIARNSHGASEPATFVSTWAGSADFFKPKLYVLAVGVSEYQQQGLNLQYAAQDAEDFVKAIVRQEGGGLYQKVSSRLLVSNKEKNNATKDDILDGLEWLERETTSRDVAMLFLAGHGVNDAEGNYQFLPQDGDPLRLRRTGIDTSEFKKFLANIAGKTVLFFDSCHSGNVIPGTRADQQADVAKAANELADAEAGVIVFSSSTGRQLSLEDERWQNGAFTEALLEGIRGKANYEKDWYISIKELDLYLAERVKELTEGKQKPVTTIPKPIGDMSIVKLDMLEKSESATENGNGNSNEK